MRHSFFLSLALLFLTVSVHAQQVTNIVDFQPGLEYENIHVYQLDHDSLASTYIIWVKENVPTHYHAAHTEVVYVLEGSGIITLGAQEKNIREGDYIFIPAGTPHTVRVSGGKTMKVLSVQSPYFDGTDRHAVSPAQQGIQKHTR